MKDTDFSKTSTDMKPGNKIKFMLSFIAGLAIHISLANTTTFTDSIPLDPGITYGVLPNGLTYYIKPIENPAAGLNLRLVVKAGFFHEAQGETEFAHLTEHLGFTEGRNILNKEGSNALDEAGIGRAEMNGLTSNDYTDYFVQTSKENRLGIDIALDFFQEVLWNLNLTEKNIDVERSTVLGEADGGNFSPNIYSHFIEKQITGWGAEPPEDYENHLKTFKPEKIISFYKKWYRPDLMAIVVTGDIDDVDKIEKRIIEKFSKGKRPDNAPRTNVDLKNYLNKTPQFYKKELKGDNDYLVYKPIRLRLYFRQFEIKKINSKQGLKDQLVRDLFIELLNKRYQEVLQEYNTFLSIRPKFLNPAAALRIEIVPEQGLNKNTIIKALKPLKQIKKYGFSAKEFSDGKKEYLKLLKKSDTLGIYYWKNQINEHFVNGEPLPEGKPEILKKILQKLDKDEFSAKIKSFIKEEPEDISIVGYNNDPTLDNSEEKIKTWIREINEISVAPHVNPGKNLVLMDTAEVKELSHPPIKTFNTVIPGTKRYRMKNGLNVILKSSNAAFDRNTIRFHGFSPYGIDCFPEEDYFSVVNATAILKNSGIGKLDKYEVKKILNEMEFDGNVSPFIKSDEAGIKGNISFKDLETALQLIYLYFTSPNFSTTAFDDWKTQQIINVAFKNFPVENFETAIREILPDRDFTPKGQKFIEGLEQINLDRVQNIYMQLFRNSKNFTFLFSGDFNEEEVLKLCQKYLGNLPVKSKSSNCLSENKESFIEPIKSRNFYSSAPLKLALIRIVYIKKTNNEFLDWKEEIQIEILRKILDELLIRRLRFESEEGGTYGIYTGMNFVNSHNYNEIKIRFEAYPGDADRLIEEAKNVVENLRNSPVDNTLFQKLKNVQLGKEETSRAILQKMHGFVRNGIPWYDDEEKKAFINSLGPEDIQQTALKYLNRDPKIFKMLPKEYLKE